MAMVAAVLLAAGLVACAPGPGPTTPPNPVVGGSVNQVYVIKAPAGAAVTLLDGASETVATGTTDSLGGYLFRRVAAGDGYRVVTTAGTATATSNPVTVMSPDAVPDPSLYTDQTLLTPDATTGYGYLNTRDGTKLSVQMQLPGPASEGPYPTLLEYSGYDPSNPSSGTGSSPWKLIAPLYGYAYVGVNMRGTGCSGGAFDPFEYLQSLDGYDAVETIAAQPWSAKIGMVGISYPGISQLFVAQTQPPNLAAISPLSATDDLLRSILAPGGIKNDGFAVRWVTERVNQNRWPNPIGADWVVGRVNAGDLQCSYNLQLRQQNRDAIGAINETEHYPVEGDAAYPEGGDLLSPWTFVDRITVPVYISGAWQDEQTGGRWPNMLDRFTGVPPGQLKITATNGTHTESLDPESFLRLTEFLELYVGEKIPSTNPLVRAGAAAIWQSVTGVPNVQLPPDRFTGSTDLAAARAAFEAEPPVRILWETGAAPGSPPGAPVPVTESSYSAWPVPEAVATPWYLQPDGRLAPTAPEVADDTARGESSYVSNPAARPRRNFAGGSGIWQATPTYDWRPLVDGASLSYLSPPLPEPVSMVGTGSVDLWLRSTAPVTDLQVTLTEVRPDGQERYVQSGWLRTHARALDEATSTELLPRHTGYESDSAPLPPGEFSEVRVELFPFAHTFRAGTQLRLAVSAPGGDRPEWAFVTPPGGETNTIAHSVSRPSRIVLPVVPTVDLPPEPAPCPSLRAQPCRAYVAPGVVSDVSAEARKRAAVVTWAAVPIPPGRTLTGYTVTASPGGSSTTVKPHKLRAKVSHLTRHTTYSFRVVANFDDGPGVASSPSPDVTTL
jgi:predicted acyl esterase